MGFAMAMAQRKQLEDTMPGTDNPSPGWTVLPVGFLEVNCHLILSVADGCLYLVDPGAQPARIVAAARAFSLPECRILLTHAHVDHISALPEVMAELGVRHVHLHPDDLRLYRSPANELPPIYPARTDLPETEPYPEGREFQVLPTPGHSRGCVCLHFPRLRAVFTGDTLFRDSVGRTDLPGGDQAVLMRSLRDLVMALPDDTAVLPGHGPATTIGRERASNPFLRNACQSPS